MLPFVSRGGGSDTAGDGKKDDQFEKKMAESEENDGKAKGRKRNDISATPARRDAIADGEGTANAVPVSDIVEHRGKKDRGKQPKKGRTNNLQRSIEEFATPATAIHGTPAASDGAVDEVTSKGGRDDSVRNPGAASAGEEEALPGGEGLEKGASADVEVLSPDDDGGAAGSIGAGTVLEGEGNGDLSSPE